VKCATGAVHHVDITVSDLASCAAFYDAVLPRMGFRRPGPHMVVSAAMIARCAKCGNLLGP
jgi:hypothetical protein